MSTKRQDDWNGMNWIRQEKRLAIYLRDGLACAYCGSSIDDGTRLSLDHVAGDGGNCSWNLVTACMRCNDSKGDRPMATFAGACAEYLGNGITASEIIQHVLKCVHAPLDDLIETAKGLIEKRGSAAKVIAYERRKRKLMEGAMEAEDRFGVDECERFADEQRRKTEAAERLALPAEVHMNANDSTPEGLLAAQHNYLLLKDEWCKCADTQYQDNQPTVYYRSHLTGDHGWMCVQCHAIVQIG